MGMSGVGIAWRTTGVGAIALFVLSCSGNSPTPGVCSRAQHLEGPEPDVTFASGSITAPTLDALVCGVTVKLISDGADAFLCQFNWDAEQPLADFQAPPAATLGLLEANLGVSALTPGSYSSLDGLCGSVSFDYHFPVVPSASCAGAVVPCPAGCAPSCADGSCDGCTQFKSEQIFDARGASNCVATTPGQPVGLWILSLSSFMPAGQGYAVHGSLLATLSDPFGPDTASLAFAF